MFTRSAQYYDRIYAFKDYASAAAQLRDRIHAAGILEGRLLDLGCGTARHLEILRQHFRVEGLDVNPALLEIARARCPDVPFHEADMTAFQLGHTFDVITCLFSSIGYVRMVDKLRQTMRRAAQHLNPRGLVLLEPWFTPESYLTERVTLNVVDDPDLKIAWMYVSERQDRLSVLDIHFIVGSSRGVEHFNEVHELGLFSHQEYVDAFESAGLTVQYDPAGPFGRGLYVGMKGD